MADDLAGVERMSIPTDPDAESGGGSWREQLTNFQKWCLEVQSVDRWPAELFSMYLVEEVPQEEWNEWYAKRLPAEVMAAGWDQFTIERAAAWAPSFLSRTPTTAQRNRAAKTIEVLENDPAVVAERERLIAADQTQHDMTFLYPEADSFAADHRVAHVQPRDVAAYLTSAVSVAYQKRAYPSLPSILDRPSVPDTQPGAWVNPLPWPTSFFIPPSSVVITVQPGMTRKDLDAVWTEVDHALKRLGGQAPKAGRKPKQHIYRRAWEVKESMHESWEGTLSKMQAEFGKDAPPNVKALMSGCYRYRSSMTKGTESLND